MSNQRPTTLEEIAARWLGTPFVPYGHQPGAGVDCAHLVAEILVEAGWIAGYRFPRYRCDEGHHAGESRVIRWLAQSGQFAQVPAGTVQPGDVLTFRIGRVAHHVGLALAQERFIHAMRGRGVLVSTLRDPTYAKRLESVWRAV